MNVDFPTKEKLFTIYFFFRKEFQDFSQSLLTEKFVNLF